MPTDWEPELTPSQAAVRLWQWGYYHDGAPGEEQSAADCTTWDDGSLEDALSFFQGKYFDSLGAMAAQEKSDWQDDGLIDPYTEYLLKTPRCGFPDTVPAMRSRYGVDPMNAKWPDACKDDLTFARLFDILNQALDQDGTDAAFELACGSWNEALKLNLRVNNALGKGASIWAGSGSLSGGVLAWSYLAQNSCAVHLEQRYNTRVEWSQRYLRAVACHELGHALGLGHLQTQEALMYPYARISVYQPAAPDITAALQLGYKKREDPVPPDPDPEPDPHDTIVRVETVYQSGRRDHFIPAESNGGNGTDW
jgi:hypothetical protein